MTTIQHCTTCGEPMSQLPMGAWQADAVIGLPSLYLYGVSLTKCANGHEDVTIPALGDLDRELAATVLTQRTLLTGPQLRFLRKWAGLNAKVFAERIGLTNVHLSRLEQGHSGVARTVDFTARMAAAKDAFDAPELGQLADLLLEMNPQDAVVKETHARFRDGSWEVFVPSPRRRSQVTPAGVTRAITRLQSASGSSSLRGSFDYLSLGTNVGHVVARPEPVGA